MKQIKTATLLATLLALPLCGCAQETATNQTDTAAMNTTNKARVAYFSATGTTKGVAERLAIAGTVTNLADYATASTFPGQTSSAFLLALNSIIS